MSYLSEDPWFLAGGLGLLGVALLIAMHVTQQGRYLIRGLIALGLAAAVLVVEHFWVTDGERIEMVVYDLRDAVVAADSERVLTYLTSDVQFVQGGNTSTGEATKALIRSTLSNAHFDFVRVSHLQTEAFPQSRRGSAEFRLIASGRLQTSMAPLNFGTTNSDWSLGFTETSPRVWKVDRITPTQLATELPPPPGSPPAGYLPNPVRRHRRSRGPQ
jgi:hypothetical protein